MHEHLLQLRQIVKNCQHQIYQPEPPVFIAGDIVHRWNEPVELVNFLLNHMPEAYAIPGNHDLPFHNYKDIDKSAYWTLVQAGKIRHMEPNTRVRVTDFPSPTWVRAFPFGSEPEPLTDAIQGHYNIALVHHYVWEEGHAFPGCPQEDHVTHMRERLKGYSAAFFGDNHKGFYSGYKALSKGKDMPIINCGAFIRRKSDDMEYDPSVYLLRLSGRIERHLLNAPDKMEKVKEVEEGGIQKINLKKFMQLVAGMDTESNDFKEYLNRLLKDMGKKHIISRDCQRLIIQILNEV